MDGRRAGIEPDPEVAATARLLQGLGRKLGAFAESLPERDQRALGAILTLAEGNHALTALRARPAEDVLTLEESAVFDQLAAEAPQAADRGGEETARMLVVIMKATRRCNLRCTYCHFWREGPDGTMSFDVLAKATRDALAVPGVRTVEFVWHGGEITLLSPAWLEKAIWLQERFRRPGQLVTNVVQSNATRITGEWLDVLRRYGIAVGVSLDGPPDLHDARRIDAAGRPTSARVAEGLARLRAHGIEHGVLFVVDRAVVDYGAQAVVDYLLELGVRDVALLNAIPENTGPDGPPAGAYLPWDDFVEWLRAVFKAWWPAHADRLVLRELADMVGLVSGRRPQTCVFAGGCHGTYLTVEPQGDVSACDKYVDDDEFEFGNVRRTTVTDMLRSSHLAEVKAANAAAVEQMRSCEWFGVCRGGCPHDRRLNEWYRPGGLNGCCGLPPLLADIAAALEQVN